MGNLTFFQVFSKSKNAFLTSYIAKNCGISFGMRIAKSNNILPMVGGKHRINKKTFFKDGGKSHVTSKS
jgi:hypothetical protein